MYCSKPFKLLDCWSFNLTLLKSESKGCFLLMCKLFCKQVFGNLPNETSKSNTWQ